MEQTSATPLTPPARTAPPRPGPSSARISGIDYARFLALIGMMAAHVWTVNADGSSALVSQLVAGKAAALFAVLAGVGIALTSRRELAEGRVGAARRNLFGRGLALIAIGLTLGLMPGGVMVILVYYGVVFWIAAPLLRWSNRGLLIGAGVLAAVWPVVSLWLRGLFPSDSLGGAPTWMGLLEEPLAELRRVFLDGAYPVPTWIVYAMVGIVIGRLMLAATAADAFRRLGLRLLAIGTALAAAAWGVSALLAGPLGGLSAIQQESGLDASLVELVFYGTSMGTLGTGSLWWLASPAPHSGMPLDLAITVGIALAMIGACLLFGAALRPAARRLLEPVRRAGAAPLTVYVAHVIAAGLPMLLIGLSGAVMDEVPWYVSSGDLWALHIAGAVLTGVILMLLNRRGPLETFVSWSGRLMSRGRGKRPGRGATLEA